MPCYFKHISIDHVTFFLIKALVQKKNDFYVNIDDDVKANPRGFYRYINGEKQTHPRCMYFTFEKRSGNGVSQSDLGKAEHSK